MTSTYELERNALAVQMERGLHAERDLAAMSGSTAIAYSLARCAYSQADLSRASGLAPATITGLKAGKIRLSNAHRAALAWAIAKR